MVPDDGIRPDAYPSWYFRPMAPVSGAISVCRKPIDDINVCDKSAKPAISGKKPFAYWHIAYKNVA